MSPSLRAPARTKAESRAPKRIVRRRIAKRIPMQNAKLDFSCTPALILLWLLLLLRLR